MCLFSKNKIVSDSRKAEILAEFEANNNHFECHKATIKGVKGTCRAFYDRCTVPALSEMLESIGEVEFEADKVFNIMRMSSTFEY